jgi:hypothetical protein
MTLVQIEAEIEKLPPQQVQELAEWLEEYRVLVGASDTLFGMYDQEEHSGTP